MKSLYEVVRDIVTEMLPRSPVAEVLTATVTSVNPLRIQTDTGTAPLDLTPATLATGLIVGDQVSCILVRGRLIILGRFATAQGWQDLALEPGFSGQVKYRRSGEWVSLRFDISGSVPNANTALTAVLPSALWPTTAGTAIYAAPSYIDPAAARAAAAVWFAADSGTLRANSGGGTAITRMRGQVSWMLG